jgi:hypothetical protein
MPDFFGKLRDSMAKGVATVGVKSKELVETTKIRTQISTLQEQVKNAFVDLGNTVYGMSMNGQWDPSAIMPKCEAIRALQEQIQQQEAQLDQVHSQSEEAMRSIQPPAPPMQSPVNSYQPGVPIAVEPMSSANPVPSSNSIPVIPNPVGAYNSVPVSSPNPIPSFSSAPVAEASTPFTLNYGQPASTPNPPPQSPIVQSVPVSPVEHAEPSDGNTVICACGTVNSADSRFCSTCGRKL